MKMHGEGPVALGPKVTSEMCLIREFIKSLRFISRPSLSHTVDVSLGSVCMSIYIYTQLIRHHAALFLSCC